MNDIETQENLWGYAKRLRFVRGAIADAFPGRRPAELRVLDVGCGSGTQLGIPLARLGYKLTGIDSHEPSIDVARRLSEKLPNASFICGRVEEIDAHDFDVVILSEVLEHVREPEGLLRSSLAHLKTFGLMIVTVPNGYGEFEWDSWMFRGLRLERLVERYAARRSAKNGIEKATSSTENQDDRHIQFFTLARLRRIFASSGLEIIDEAPSTFISGPLAGHILTRVSGFIDWNVRVADWLPMAVASGWFFALRRNSEGNE